MTEERTRVAILGGGPAGLTAAYLLAKDSVPVLVLEQDPQYLGGISRTVSYKGFHFDIGGHRFYTKSERVQNLWKEILPHDFLEKERHSRILYRGKYYSYPLKPVQALLQLGFLESLRCLLSYSKSKIFSVSNPVSFEDWMVGRFGKRLYEIFFKTYTEKVWGIPCKEISKDWAEQRIGSFSLGEAIKSALKGEAANSVHRTLASRFWYPRKGPGMFWEEAGKKIAAFGGQIQQGRRVTRVSFDGFQWRVFSVDENGKESVVVASEVISSLSLSSLIQILDPAPPVNIQNAARGLKYRDFVTVGLLTDQGISLQDQWVYIHEPHVKVGRIQNFQAWSEEMVPDPSKRALGLEYFCQEGDELWNQSNEEWIRLASAELQSLGIVKAGSVLNGYVIRQKKAYPAYHKDTAGFVQEIKSYLDQFSTLQSVGRNGLHRYNNQDHSMLTAIRAVENIQAGYRKFDVWDVNADESYLEREVPKLLSQLKTQEGWA